MPYKIEKVKGGYYVSDIFGKRYSNKPISKDSAMKQIIALHIHTKH